MVHGRGERLVVIWSSSAGMITTLKMGLNLRCWAVCWYEVPVWFGGDGEIISESLSGLCFLAAEMAGPLR